MRRACLALLVPVALLAPACSFSDGSASAGPSGPSPPGSVVAAPSPSLALRVPLPSGFPVPSGAEPLAPPDDDPGLIGRWSTNLPGPSAYDFYVEALPAAGFPIVAVYPGGEAAVIRFTVSGGATWQVVMRAGANGGVAIEVRLDRP